MTVLILLSIYKVNNNQCDLSYKKIGYIGQIAGMASNFIITGSIDPSDLSYIFTDPSYIFDSLLGPSDTTVSDLDDHEYTEQTREASGDSFNQRLSELNDEYEQTRDSESAITEWLEGVRSVDSIENVADKNHETP